MIRGVVLIQPETKGRLSDEGITMSKGAKERADTRYVVKDRQNTKTKRWSQQVLLDPNCKKAQTKMRASQ